MREKQLSGTVLGQREAIADFFGQVLVCELHFVAEDRAGRIQVLRDDAAALVWVE